MAQVSPARKAAFAILLAMERGKAHSDELLRGRAVSRLSTADRNLTTALVLGVLRWQIALDTRVRPLLKRPNAKLDSEALIALRLGAFQLLHMDRIPAHAAIGESVELAAQAGHRFASGMVNAVLRRIAEGADGYTATGSDAYPAWMVQRWMEFFGEEAADAICQYGQSQAVLTVRLADERVEAELADAGIELTSGKLLSAARTVKAGDVTATDAFRGGRARVQDEGSQIVAEIAGLGTSIRPSMILDCCAAPGGKTLVLAERNPQARIVACDANAGRLEALRARVEWLGDRIDCKLADAAALSEDAEYDLVLADVPCSGTGTLGRNPEIRHRLKPEEFARQVEKQRAILAGALRAARPGGRVVYSTCSLEPEENEQVVASVLGGNATARVVPMEAQVEEMRTEGVLAAGAADKLRRCITPEGYLRLMPGALGTDGFFVALMEKAGG